MSEIYCVDDRWSSEDDDINLEFFHRLLAYKNIRSFINKHGMSKYNELCRIFPTVGQHGYDVKEAMRVDLTIIKRK